MYYVEAERSDFVFDFLPYLRITIRGDHGDDMHYAPEDLLIAYLFVVLKRPLPARYYGIAIVSEPPQLMHVIVYYLSDTIHYRWI